ncbi:MAG: VOC family protein [Dermatophilaceae bacterium]
MRVVGIIADLPVADIASAKGFYSNYLGLTVEEFNMEWVARFTAPETGATVQLVTDDLTAPENPVISVKVDDVEAAYADARQRGYDIVHPLTVEQWGVRRFFVRAPDGNVINIVQHHD